MTFERMDTAEAACRRVAFAPQAAEHRDLHPELVGQLAVDVIDIGGMAFVRLEMRELPARSVFQDQHARVGRMGDDRVVLELHGLSILGIGLFLIGIGAMQGVRRLQTAVWQRLLRLARNDKDALHQANDYPESSIRCL